MTPRNASRRALADRIESLNWPALATELDDLGCAQSDRLLDRAECDAIQELYDTGSFRATIDMARYRFGAGEYKYFDHPLPGIVDALRHAFWPHLLPIARAWTGRLHRPAPWPDDFDDWIAACHAAGQSRPTPLLLKYRTGDWNALHRDLYGDLVFPLQVVIALDVPDVDYAGGEFLVIEQRPRAQSRGTATVLGQGHALVFTTRDRPVRSTRGWSAAPVRHGVSVLRRGHRMTLGLVFHDAQ
jgi:uncharacterized protein